MCRGWHAALAAAPELVLTVRLSCVYDADEDSAAMRAQDRHMDSFPHNYINGCPKLRAAMDQLQALSPRTLAVGLQGFDWSLQASCMCLRGCVAASRMGGSSVIARCLLDRHHVIAV